MEKEDQESITIPKLHIRYELVDGRVSALCVWPDGEWKVEIFASRGHAMAFAKANSMEVIFHDDDQSA